MRISVKSVKAKTPFDVAVQALNLCLSRSQLPFPVKFQAMKLALNGHLSPPAVINLADILVNAITKGHSTVHCAEALRQFDRDLPWPGPQTPTKDLDPEVMRGLLQKLISNDLENRSIYRAVRSNNTLALIHHVRVTPAGLYLEGPEPEVKPLHIYVDMN
jgi:hypothetical protein